MAHMVKRRRVRAGAWRMCGQPPWLARCGGPGGTSPGRRPGRWRAGPERTLEASSGCRGGGGALVEQGAGMGGDRGRYGDTYRPAKLLGGVDEPGGHADVVLGDPSQGGDRDRDEGKCGADADDEERPGQAGPEVAAPASCSGRSAAA